MALSLTPVELWDFQDASTPLVGQTYGTTFVAQNGAVVSTTNGLELNVAADFFRVSGGLDAALQSFTLPFTVVMVCQRKTGDGTSNYRNLFERTTSGGASLWKIDHSNPNSPTTNVLGIQSIGSARYPNVNQTIDTTAVLTVTWTSTKTQAWRDTTNLVDSTHASTPATAPTLTSTDRLNFGTGVSHSGMYVYAAALFDGELTSQDRTDLAADWRSALFGSASTLFRPYFITG